MIITLDDIVHRRTKKYDILYADPPWSYTDKMIGHSFSLDHEYETQDIEWICGLPIELLASKNSALFLWGVSPQLPEAFKVIKRWGFEYKTVAFCWSKVGDDGKLISNLGRWTMGNVELCLLSVRGKPKRVKENVKQFVRAKRTTHSKKPIIVRERIVELMGDVPRIELFAREVGIGWDAFGYECKNTVNNKLDSYI